MNNCECETSTVCGMRYIIKVRNRNVDQSLRCQGLEFGFVVFVPFDFGPIIITDMLSLNSQGTFESAILVMQTIFLDASLDKNG